MKEADVIPFVRNTIKAFAEGLTTQRPASKREFELNVVHPMAWWAINEYGIQPATNVINIYARLGVLAVGLMGANGMKKIIKGEQLDVGRMIQTRAGEFKRGGTKAKVMTVSAPEEVIKSPMQILIAAGKVERKTPVASNKLTVAPVESDKLPHEEESGEERSVRAASHDDDEERSVRAASHDEDDDEDNWLFGIPPVASSTRLRRPPSGAPSLSSRRRPSGSKRTGAAEETAGDKRKRAENERPYEDGSADEESGAVATQDASPEVTDAEAALELSKAQVTASKPKLSSLSSGDYICLLRSEYPKAPVRDEESVGWATEVMPRIECRNPSLIR